MLSVRETPQGVVFKVVVQPRSSKNMLAGLYGDALKVKLTAPPVGGAANEMCLAFLAKHLGVAKTTLAITSGHSGRRKQILVLCAGEPPPSAESARLRRRIESLAGALKTP